MKSFRQVLIAVLIIATPVMLAGPAAADDWDTCYKQSGDVAFSACSRAIESESYQASDVAILYNNRGIEYWRKDDNDRAIQDYDQAIKFNPQYAKAFNNRGTAYYDKKDYGHAVDDYSEAIALNPEYPSAYFSLFKLLRASVFVPTFNLNGIPTRNGKANFGGVSVQFSKIMEIPKPKNSLSISFMH